MAESDEVYIKNPNNDFAMIQNYVIQLVAEKKITASAMVLYAFYQSLNGFSEIHVGYRYICENTGLSMGTVTKCNQLLMENNLIKINKRGKHSNFIIELVPNNLIPRRELKVPVREFNNEEECSEFECSSDEQESQKMNTFSSECSSDEHIHIIQQDISNTYTTTTTGEEKNLARKSNLNKIKEEYKIPNKKKTVAAKPVVSYTAEEAQFIDAFVNTWRKQCKSKYYTKKDFEVVKQIGDFEDATKYIPILWCLDDIDKWVKNSDHTLSVFIKEYKSGRLQALYPKTVYAMNE